MSDICHKYILTQEEDMPDSGDSMNEGEQHMSQVIWHKYIITPKEDMPDSGDSMNKGEWHMSQVYTQTGRGFA